MGILVGTLSLSGGCAAMPPCPLPAETMQLPPATAQPTVSEVTPPLAQSMSPATLGLEHKVKMQEKRIAELSSQLRLLKRIDLDRSKQ